MDYKEAYKKGEYEKVVEILPSPTSKEELWHKAISLQKLGKFESAMQLWNSLIKIDNENAEYYVERGVCKYNLKFRHALEDFDTAISLEPDSAYYFSCRAYVRDKLGQTEGAVDDYRKAHELDPSDALILNNLGLAEQKLGHTSAARKFFKKSNDLIGISTADAEEPQTKPYKPSAKDKWKEVLKMLSSWKEFRAFVKELFQK